MPDFDKPRRPDLDLPGGGGWVGGRVARGHELDEEEPDEAPVDEAVDGAPDGDEGGRP